MNGAVFKTVCEIVRAILGWFDSDTPPPNRFWNSDFGLVPPKSNFLDITNKDVATQDEMKYRTKQSALCAIRLVEPLLAAKTANVIETGQRRGGTSVRPNYRAAYRTKSTGDFINKTGIVEEEAKEKRQILATIISSIKTLKNDRIPRSEISNSRLI